MCYYNLTDIRKKIDDGDYFINHDVTRSAFQDFGWGAPEIKGALRKLKDEHHIQTAPYRNRRSQIIPGVMVGYYEGHINGEDIYTHFYVDRSGKLIVNSFKKSDFRGR